MFPVTVTFSINCIGGRETHCQCFVRTNLLVWAHNTLSYNAINNQKPFGKLVSAAEQKNSDLLVFIIGIITFKIAGAD